jgi:hypothetical protein
MTSSVISYVVLTRARLLDIGNDLIQRLLGEKRFPLRRVVAVARCKLVNEPDRVRCSELTSEQLKRSMGNLCERLRFHDHGPISAISSRGLTTFGGPM